VKKWLRRTGLPVKLKQRMKVIAQLRGNKDFRGFRAIRIDSKAEKLFRISVLTIGLSHFIKDRGK